MNAAVRGRPACRAPRFGLWHAVVLFFWAVAAAPVAQAATQTYVVTSFDSIRVEAPVKVVLKTGGGLSARGEGDRASLDRVDLQVSGRLLVVRIRPSVSGKRDSGPVTLHLSTEQIRRAFLTGGGALVIDRMKGQRGEVTLNGGGELSVGTVMVDHLTALLSGGGQMTLNGQAGRAMMRLSGPGSLAAEGLTIRDVQVFGDGSGEMRLTASGSADIRARGSGNVTVLGKAACTVLHSGSGRVTCGAEER